VRKRYSERSRRDSAYEHTAEERATRAIRSSSNYEFDQVAAISDLRSVFSYDRPTYEPVSFSCFYLQQMRIRERTHAYATSQSGARRMEFRSSLFVAFNLTADAFIIYFIYFSFHRDLTVILLKI